MISSLTVHRFIIAAVTVAAKTICDSYCTNAHYARVGGISVQELNTLEVRMLLLMNWQVAVREQTVQEYYVNLVGEHAHYTRSRSSSTAERDSDSRSVGSIERSARMANNT